MDQPLSKIASYPNEWITWIFADCGHWVLVRRGDILDGCPKCRMTSMRDDRHAPRRNY